jgi:hypothetical protein
MLLWLAMCALPLHGLALGAGTMEACDLARSMESQAADGHLQDKVTPALDTAACDGCPQSVSGSSFSHGKCSPSAACSLVAASAFADITVGEPDASAKAPPAPRTARVAFLTGGPDRPPRR